MKDFSKRTILLKNGSLRKRMKQMENERYFGKRKKIFFGRLSKNEQNVSNDERTR